MFFHATLRSAALAGRREEVTRLADEDYRVGVDLTWEAAGRARSIVAAQLAVANGWPIEKCDEAVEAVLGAFGFKPMPTVIETPQRKALLAPLRRPPEVPRA